MIGYFGNVIFETNDRKICNFNHLKRTISARYSEHRRYTEKPQREFEGPENQGVSFEMKFVAGYGVKPLAMLQEIIRICENGTVCQFVIGGHKMGGGNWIIEAVSADYNRVWNQGELVSVSVSVTASEYY